MVDLTSSLDLPGLKKNGVVRGDSIKNSDLFNKNYSQYKFINLNIEATQIRQIKFEKCSFENIKLKDCELKELVFIDCNIKHLDLDNVIATEVNFNGSKLALVTGQNIFIENCKLQEGALSKFNCKKSSLYGTTVVGSILDELKLTNNEIKQSSIVESEFSQLNYQDNTIKIRISSECKYVNSEIIGGEAEDLIFFKAEINQFKIQALNINRISFHQANLHEVLMEDLRLGYANFVESKVQNCHYANVNFSYSQFTDAQLVKNSYTKCMFSHSLFNRAKIHNCSFSKSEFDHCDYRGAEIQSSNLFKTKQTANKTHGAKVELVDRQYLKSDPILSAIEKWYAKHKVGPRNKKIHFPSLPSGVSRYGN